MSSLDILPGATITVPAGDWWPVGPTGRPAQVPGAHEVVLRIATVSPPSQHEHGAGCAMPPGRYQTVDARVIGGDGRMATFMICIRPRGDTP